MPLDQATVTEQHGPATQLHGCRTDLWPAHVERQKCAVCGLQGNDLRLVLNLGEQPLANALLTAPVQYSRLFPLQLGECRMCGHIQLIQTVRADLMFEEYVYRTGISATMRQHFAKLADWLGCELSPGSQVCEVGCNDGTLLKALRLKKMCAFGVDPSSVAASVEGETVHPRYFNIRCAEGLRAEYGPVDCVVMTNVLAHVPQPLELIRGAWEMLRDGGLLVIEAPYVRDLVRNLAYDTCYHEHGHYFSLRDLARMLAGKFWKVEVECLPVHGGSLRLICKKTPYSWLSLWGADEGWTDLLADEDTAIDWEAFSARIAEQREALRWVVAESAQHGEVVGYGAPAKATVLLNYCGIHLSRIVDDTPEKQGKFVPGVGTPIVPRSELGDPEAVVILPCNFEQEIRAKEPGLRGRWIIPLPTVRRL